MQDENLATPQEGMSPESEVIEETVVEETTETPEIEEVLEETVPKSQFNQVLARAKKAEDALKKQPKENITNKQNSLSEEEVEVKILKSQGMTDDLIKDLKAVAKARGKSLIDSVNDSIFVAIKNEKEADGKAKKAKLGASKGSGIAKKEKDVNSVGLSDEDHKELWKQMRDK